MFLNPICLAAYLLLVVSCYLKDSKISFAVKQGLSQAMQIRRKVSIVAEPSPTQSESPGIEEMNQDKTLKDEGAETAEAAEQVLIVLRMNILTSF